jgi:ribosomal protein S27AE
MKEALKLALEALEELNETNSYWWQDVEEETVAKIDPAITAIKAALAQQESVRLQCVHCGTVYADGVPPAVPAQPAQKPIGKLNLGGMINTSEGLEYDDWDVELSRKTIEALQERLVTCDPVTLDIYTSQQLAQERNFCSRCGKRTADLAVIHTCTPPQENT